MWRRKLQFHENSDVIVEITKFTHLEREFKIVLSIQSSHFDGKRPFLFFHEECDNLIDCPKLPFIRGYCNIMYHDYLASFIKYE